MVTLIPNQPIKMIENDETLNQRNERLMWDRRQFCQLVKSDQVQYYQFQVTPQSGNNLIANGTFLNNLNSWNTSTWGYTVASVIPGQPVTGVAASVASSGVYSAFFLTCEINQNFGTTTTNKTLRLSFDVAFNDIDDGGVSYLVTSLSGSVQCIGGQVILGNNNNSAGRYTSYWRVSSTSILYFSALHQSTDGQIVLDNVELVEMTEPIFTLEDCNGNYIKDLNDITRVNDIVIVRHSWANLVDEQCYRICLYGSDEDFSFNYFGSIFCIRDTEYHPITDSNGECISFYPQ